MAVYEYRCTTCDEVFELRRPMAAAGDEATCPQGHVGARRVFSVFAAVGTSAGGFPSAAPSGDAPMGPCGGACACRPG